MSNRTLNAAPLLFVLVGALTACGSDLSEVECTSSQQCAASLVCVAGDCVRPEDADGDASNTDTGEDTGVDTGEDARVDTGEDSGVDTGEDARVDTGEDTGVDTGEDTTEDTAPDTGDDAAGDAGIDTAADVDPDTPTDTGTDTPPVDTGLDTAADTATDTPPDTTPRCGNGVVDDGETCDPAISLPPGAPPCRDDCSYCGDGAVDPTETCDPAAPDSDLCALDCSQDWAGLVCAPCPGGRCDGPAECTPRATMVSICLPTCLNVASRDCPAGWTCNLSQNVCVPPDGACPEVCDPTEICGNGIDDDCDGDVDCGDLDCSTRPECVESEAICDDLIDNDGDGATDCADDDCGSDPVCAIVPEVCDDGIDNDGDGATDCEDDGDCADDPACLAVTEVCDDGVDNDGNGLTDCEDLVPCGDLPECATDCLFDDIGTTVGPRAYTWSGMPDDLEPNALTCFDDAYGFSVRWTAPRSGTFLFDVENPFDGFGPGLDTHIEIRRASCSGAVLECDGITLDGPLSFTAAAGATYVIKVGARPFDIPIPIELQLYLDIGEPEMGTRLCTDGIDNDLDGATDCFDSDCSSLGGCRETACDDGVDNDGDGSADCDDPDCDTSPVCLPGACGSDDDQDIIASGAADEAATTCGLGCLGDADPLECTTECIPRESGLSAECAWCYGSNFECIVDFCLATCASDPTGEACVDCQTENCLEEFELCTGPLP